MSNELALFEPSWWLRGPHLQTVWGVLTRRRRVVPYVREVVNTPDGDELVLDHLPGPADSPCVLVMHGLEGSSYSVYIQGLMSNISRKGWRATVMNFRYCARDPYNIRRSIPNRTKRLYHSGETTDFDFILKRTVAQNPDVPLLAVGVSLGGNVLIKYLGEQGLNTPIRAAAALSVPFDLAGGARHLESRVGRLYSERFLGTLRAKAAAVATRFPEATRIMDVGAALKARTIWSFDDACTAPLHGFADAADYYARSSSLSFVDKVQIPTLCLSSEDDPLVAPGCASAARQRASSSVEVQMTPGGGHVGFVTGLPWSCRYWAEEHCIDWLSKTL